MSVPYLTLDPATGEMVAMLDDGTVTPLSQGGLGYAGNRTYGSTGAGGGVTPIQPNTGSAGLSGRSRPAGSGDTPTSGDFGAAPIPEPGSGGGYVDARARLAAARARISGAFGGGYSGGGSSGYDSDSGIPEPRPLRGRYARGLDPAQAAGLSYRPTAMLPRVFPGLTPADPLYGNLAELPVGQWATILGNGSPQSLANTVGGIYHRAGTTGNLPSTDRLLRSLQRGNGVEDMIEGVKAGPNDYQSSIAPGYVYGQEPMPMAEAATAYGSLLDAALSQEPLLTAQKYGVESGGWGSFLVDKWASKAMKRAPGKGTPVYRSVGRRLFR